MNPTIGRIVHFHSTPSEKHPEEKDFAAIITDVYEDNKVNLTCFLPSGALFFRKNVEEGTGHGQWSWPPRVG